MYVITNTVTDAPVDWLDCGQLVTQWKLKWVWQCFMCKDFHLLLLLNHSTGYATCFRVKLKTKSQIKNSGFLWRHFITHVSCIELHWRDFL